MISTGCKPADDDKLRYCSKYKIFKDLEEVKVIAYPSFEGLKVVGFRIERSGDKSFNF